jgi:hypothetical protein
MNGEEYEQEVPRSGEPSPSNRVIPLQPSHTQALVKVLSRAFHHEPYFTYMLPDDNERRCVLPGFLSSIIDVSHLYGEGYTTTAVEGGAVWVRPDQISAFHKRLRARLRATNLTLSRTSFDALHSIEQAARPCPSTIGRDSPLVSRRSRPGPGTRAIADSTGAPPAGSVPS